MSSQDWDVFAVALAGVLTRSPALTVVNLEAGGRTLGITKDADGLSLCLTDDLSESKQQRLRTAGWAGPDSDTLWWFRVRETGLVACRDIAVAATDVLRSVYEVELPGDVRAEGWVDAPTDRPVPLGQLRASAPPLVDDDARSVLSVAELLLADYPWLVATVRYRLTDPEESFDPGPWRGLLDILGDPDCGGLGVIVRFGWRSQAHRARNMLQRLPSHPAVLSWDWFPDFLTETANWDSGDIIEVLLDRVGKRSSALGFALVSLETEGDDYAVTFLRLDQAERLSTVTAVAGRRVLALPFSR